MNVAFWKLYAEGNAYVVVDQPAAVAGLLPWVTSAEAGLGGDGLLLAEWRVDDEVGMRIFNADGTAAAACGNGARCLAALAVRTGRASADRPVRVISPGLTIEHRVLDRSAWRLSQHLRVPADPVLWDDGTSTQVVLGAPHRVIFTDLAVLDLDAAGPAAQRAWPGGTNVMFAQVVTADRIDVLPWERGVGRTLGCATGAAAAALVAGRRFPDRPARCTVRQPGGSIDVTWHDGALTMEGSVRFVAEGTVQAG